jgi:hypothetical protein
MRFLKTSIVVLAVLSLSSCKVEECECTTKGYYRLDGSIYQSGITKYIAECGEVEEGADYVSNDVWTVTKCD